MQLGPELEQKHEISQENEVLGMTNTDDWRKHGAPIPVF